MKDLFVVWEYCIKNKSTNEVRYGVKNTHTDLDDFNKNHFENPGKMDEVDWLMAGLFFDQVLAGNNDKELLLKNEVFENISVYGFYKTYDKAKEAFNKLINEKMINSK